MQALLADFYKTRIASQVLHYINTQKMGKKKKDHAIHFTQSQYCTILYNFIPTPQWLYVLQLHLAKQSVLLVKQQVWTMKL